MSKVVTPPLSQPGSSPLSQPTTPQLKIPHEKIAMRAYEKWIQRGRPDGTDRQNWLEAEAELRAEYQRTGGLSNTRR